MGRTSRFLIGLGLVVTSSSCDPLIYFFERPSNVSVRLTGENVARIRYWEEGRLAAHGERAVAEVASAVFPGATISDPAREGEVYVVDVSVAWTGRRASTIVIDGRLAYRAVATTTGQRRQGIGYCVPEGIRHEISTDRAPFEVHGGCGVWSVDSPSEAPLIELTTRPAVREALLDLALAAIGIASGSLMIWLLVRRRAPDRLPATLLGMLPLVSLMLSTPFSSGGDFEAFRLVGLGLMSALGKALAIGHWASLVVGAVFILVSRRASGRGHPPPRPDSLPETPPDR